MCTAISFNATTHFFGRNLDLNYPFVEKIVVTPKNSLFNLKSDKEIRTKYALYGIGIVKDNYPFYFDCANECGVGFAGLNFPGYACFFDPKQNLINIAPYELPLYFLGMFSSVKDIKKVLKKTNISNIPYSDSLPLSTLHYIFSDKDETIVVEQTKDGLHIYENKIGVLTNNPPFDFHLLNLANYMSCSPHEPINKLTKKMRLVPSGKGFGSIGLPGDSTPQSRFIKAAYLLETIDKVCKKDQLTDEEKLINVNAGFHVLNNVSMTKGECIMKDGSKEYTVYSSLYDLSSVKLFIKTYENNQLNCYELSQNDLNSLSLKIIDISHEEKINILK